MSFSITIIREPSIKDAYHISSMLSSILLEQQRSPELEQIIAQDATQSYRYAVNEIKGRFILGEKVISKDPKIAYHYTQDIIKGRWPDGESSIAENPDFSYKYARHILDGRFELGEPAIKRNHELYTRYKEFIKLQKVELKYLEVAEMYKLSVNDVKEISRLVQDVL